MKKLDCTLKLARPDLLQAPPQDAGVKPGQPITRVIDCNVYTRPADGGLMFGGYDYPQELTDTPVVEPTT